MPRRLSIALTSLLLAVLSRGTSTACEGAGCMQIWSTAAGGGALTVQWDFSKKVKTAAFCLAGQCIDSTNDPGFMATTLDDNPDDSYYVLRDGTTVQIVITSFDCADPGSTFCANATLSLHNVNHQTLSHPGDSATLGTMPPIHVHPSWQIAVPADQFGDYTVSYKLTTDSPLYTESEVFTSIVTNVPPPEDTPTPTVSAEPSPTRTPCPADCSNDGVVTADELLHGVSIALGRTAMPTCGACDTNHDGAVSVDELVAGIDGALGSCTAPPPATLELIQQTIFTPSCATLSCHDSQGALTNNLDLSASLAYGQLVNVPPSILLAQQAGLLRVDPGHPENSFLLVKISGPPPLGEGEVMPLTGGPLAPEQIDLIRNWILQGAKNP